MQSFPYNGFVGRSTFRRIRVRRSGGSYSDGGRNFLKDFDWPLRTTLDAPPLLAVFLAVDS